MSAMNIVTLSKNGSEREVAITFDQNRVEKWGHLPSAMLEVGGKIYAFPTGNCREGQFAALVNRISALAADAFETLEKGLSVALSWDDVVGYVNQLSDPSKIIVLTGGNDHLVIPDDELTKQLKSEKSKLDQSLEAWGRLSPWKVVAERHSTAPLVEAELAHQQQLIELGDLPWSAEPVKKWTETDENSNFSTFEPIYGVLKDPSDPLHEKFLKIFRKIASDPDAFEATTLFEQVLSVKYGLGIPPAWRLLLKI